MSPPPQPVTKSHHHHLLPFPRHQPGATLPEVLFTALSVLFLFSHPSSSSSSSSTAKARALKIPVLSCRLNLRRFLRIPTMSRPGPKIHHRFANPQSLSDWLKPRLPSDSFASWGVKPGTKNVHNLWLEISEGETSLADSVPPIRTVNVVSVRVVGANGRVLVESRQELSDGSIRHRCRPLSEKMKPSETPEMAVIRAVREELGSVIRVEVGGIGDVVRIVPGSYKMKVEERNSLSYPGLPACYMLHSFEVEVEGLPEDAEFCTEEEEEYEGSGDAGVANRAVSVRRHYWKWVSADSIES
ncbi:LEA_2 domain-containing protein [Psidium guajava]|nr:LEA_2 domain-containing protein [Psidium guajava]